MNIINKITGTIYRFDVEGEDYIAFPLSRINAARIVVVLAIIVTVLEIVL